MRIMLIITLKIYPGWGGVECPTLYVRCTYYLPLCNCSASGYFLYSWLSLSKMVAIMGNVALSDSVNTGKNQGSQRSADTLGEKGLVSEGHQDT